MRVCIDIQAAIAQRAGVGRYTKSLVEHLGPHTGDDQLRLCYFDFKRHGEPFPVPVAEHRGIQWCPGRLVQGAWKMVAWPPYNWFAGHADVYHFPNFIRPPLSQGRSVVTIHDLAFIRYPQTIESGNYRYLTRCIEETVRHSDAVIAVSRFTGQELQELLHVPRDRIFAIHEAISSNLAPPPAETIDAVRGTLKLERPYLLTVGTLEPRKNIPFLIEAFELLRHFDGDLVIAGMRGWNFEPILERLRASPQAARIRYLEFVDEAQLPALYAGAELFVFPSLYEGFGFPPLEAMACGTAVVSSAGGSLPEVLGSAAVIMDNYDAARWAVEIDDLLGQQERLDSLVVKGFSQVRQYSWDQAARETWDVYRQLVS